MTSFQEGDIVKDPYHFTGEGTIGVKLKSKDIVEQYPVRVTTPDERVYSYTEEGKYLPTAETPSLVLVRRPVNAQIGIWLLANGETAVITGCSTCTDKYYWGILINKDRGTPYFNTWTAQGISVDTTASNLKTFIGPLPTKKDEE